MKEGAVITKDNPVPRQLPKGSRVVLHILHQAVRAKIVILLHHDQVTALTRHQHHRVLRQVLLTLLIPLTHPDPEGLEDKSE